LIILVKLPEKIEIFSPGSTTPQCSNQIDAAATVYVCMYILMYTKHTGICTVCTRVCFVGIGLRALSEYLWSVYL